MHPDASPLRVAVPLRGFAQWGGGLDFIRLILEGLVHRPDTQVVALIPRPTAARRLREFAGTSLRALKDLARLRKPQWRPSSPFSPEQVLKAIQDFTPRIEVAFYPDSQADLFCALSDVKADAAIPCMEPLAAGCPVPWVGYIFDFQHHYLPHFFTAEESASRDKAFRAMLDAARVVICNSESVRTDAEKFQSGASDKVLALPFAPTLRREWLALEPGPVRQRYGLPARYFMVCNQFWVHKDHATAIRAFAQYVRGTADTDAALVCTGSLHDFRAPDHAATLQALIRELGIESRVHLLGHISKRDQIALMRGALALLQPTLFEGGRGGGAVYDAVALGVPALVSDIPVNLEITDGSCRFFRQQDPASLAALMARVAAEPTPAPAPDTLVAAMDRRISALNDTLLQAVRAARPRAPDAAR